MKPLASYLSVNYGHGIVDNHCRFRRLKLASRPFARRFFRMLEKRWSQPA